ncbi:MAG: FMN-dependent NADH-azoreductase [Metamycoplasmataceae bacterium]
MSKVLVIESSVNGERSITNKAVQIFIENYKLANPNDDVEILDLNKVDKVSRILTSENFNIFFNEEADQLINQLKSADKLVISAGMINFNVPTSLKSYFDNVLQAGKTFKYKYKGNGESIGLLNHNVKAQLILSQGAVLGWYGFGEFEKYLQGTLKFMGVSNVETVMYDGTKTNAKSSLTAEEIIDKEYLITLAKKF